MSLEMCEHCRTRVRKGMLEVHLRRCVKYRRKMKALKVNEGIITPVDIVKESPIPQTSKKRKAKMKVKDETNN